MFSSGEFTAEAVPAEDDALVSPHYAGLDDPEALEQVGGRGWAGCCWLGRGLTRTHTGRWQGRDGGAYLLGSEHDCSACRQPRHLPLLVRPLLMPLPDDSPPSAARPLLHLTHRPSAASTQACWKRLPPLLPASPLPLLPRCCAAWRLSCRPRWEPQLTSPPAATASLWRWRPASRPCWVSGFVLPAAGVVRWAAGSSRWQVWLPLCVAVLLLGGPAAQPLDLTPNPFHS